MDWKASHREDSAGHRSASLLLRHKNKNGNHIIDGQTIEGANDNPEVIIIGKRPIYSPLEIHAFQPPIRHNFIYFPSTGIECVILEEIFYHGLH